MAKITRYKGDAVTALSFALAVVTVVAFGLWLYPKVKTQPQPEAVGNASKFEANLNLNIKMETPSTKVTTSQPLNTSSNGLGETEPAGDADGPGGGRDGTRGEKEIKLEELFPILVAVPMIALCWTAWRNRKKLFDAVKSRTSGATDERIQRWWKTLIALCVYLFILITIWALFPEWWSWWRNRGNYFFYVTAIGIPLLLAGFFLTNWAGQTAIAILVALLAYYGFRSQVKDGYAGLQVWWNRPPPAVVISESSWNWRMVTWDEKDRPLNPRMAKVTLHDDQTKATCEFEGTSGKGSIELTKQGDEWSGPWREPGVWGTMILEPNADFSQWVGRWESYRGHTGKIQLIKQ